MLQEMQLGEDEFAFDSSLCEPLQELDSIEVPLRSAKQTEGFHLQADVVQDGNPDAGNLLDAQFDVVQTDERSVELAPERVHLLVSLDLALQLSLEFVGFLLTFLHLQSQRCFLALNDWKGALTHLQSLLNLLQRGLIILKLYCHTCLFAGAKIRNN